MIQKDFYHYFNSCVVPVNVHVGTLECAYVSVLVCHNEHMHPYVWVPSEARGVGSPRAGVRAVVSHRTWVLRTTYRSSELLNHPPKALWVWGCLLSYQLLFHLILSMPSLSVSVELW